MIPAAASGIETMTPLDFWYLWEEQLQDMQYDWDVVVDSKKMFAYVSEIRVWKLKETH